jgi:hypothetical protein
MASSDRSSSSEEYASTLQMLAANFFFKLRFAPFQIFLRRLPQRKFFSA